MAARDIVRDILSDLVDLVVEWINYDVLYIKIP